MLLAGLAWCGARAFEKESPQRAPETQILPAARSAATLLSEPTLPILTDRLASVWAARQVDPATGYALLSAADGLPWQPATTQAVPASPWQRAPVDRDGLAASVAPGRVLLDGNWTSSATVHADGAFTFGGRVPAPVPGQLLLAPFLGNLYLDPATGGRVWTLADAACALVAYENLQLEGDPGTSLSAQAAFHADGRVAFRYGPLAGATNLAGRLLAGTALGTNRWDWLSDGTNGVPGTLREGLELTFLPADEGVWMTLDTDGDGLPDFLEAFCGTDPASPDDPDTDPDGDGLPTLDEAVQGTDPHNPDTDGDGLADLLEVQNGRDPLVPGGEGDTESAAFRLTLRPVPPAGGGTPGGRAVLAIGPLAVPFSEEHPVVDRWFRLPRGRAHGLRLVGDLRGGAVEATLHFPHEGMVLYDPDGVFGPGLPAGTPAPFASAFLAFPTVALDPATPCVHTPRPRTVTATVQPPGLPGTFHFTLPDGTAAPAESADGTTSLSVGFPAGETRVLTVDFLSATRPATTVVPPVRLLADVAQCPEPLPDEGGADDWDDFLGWPGDAPETEPPTPAQVHFARTFLPMNSDDDDADGAPDHGQSGSVANEDDLLPILPRPAHTDCCACPEHSATVPGQRLASLSPGLRLWTSRERTQAFAAGTYASVGQVLYLEGTGASAALGDQAMDWVEVEGGTDGDHHVTGHTVMRLQVQPDLDGDNDVDADDLVLRPGVSEEHGVLYGAASNRFHRIDLRTDGSVPGTYELRLDGPEGAFRVWGNATGTGTPLLSLFPGGNNTATVSPVSNRPLWLECLGPGAGTLRYRWRDPDGEPRFGDALAFTGVEVEMPRVWSDQFPGTECYFLPDGHGAPKDSGEAFLLIGARADGNVYTKATVSINPDVPDVRQRLLFRIAEDSPPLMILKGISSLASDGCVALSSSSFSVQRHKLVGGIDANCDGILMANEVLWVFPHEMRFVGLSDILISQLQLTAQLNVGGALAGLVVAADHLHEFLCPSPDGIYPETSISASDNRLEHRIGLNLNENCMDSTVRSLIYESNDIAAELISVSRTLQDMVEAELTLQKTTVQAFFNDPANNQYAGYGVWIPLTQEIWYADHAVWDQDLFFAFGKAMLEASVLAWVSRETRTVVQAELVGQQTDLYDWDFTLDPAPAMVQAGYLTLSPNGHIFHNVVLLDNPMTSVVGFDMSTP